MTSRHDSGWDAVYHRNQPEGLPWELGKPRRVLVNLVESGQVQPGDALDLCCGMGTNPVFLAKKGFHVTALDVSDKALEEANKQAHTATVNVKWLVADFLRLPFQRATFDFAFDFGCFHHVKVQDRIVFIEELLRILKNHGMYLLVCFSYKNGPAWNHFRRVQIIQLFENKFQIKWIKHVSSRERDNVIRYFYEVLMEKPPLT